MGIYLPNIEMPKESRLTLQISANGAVYVVNGCSVTAETYTTDAVPVSPHGDLIDRDKMRETIKPWSPEDEMAGCTFDTVKKLMHTMISRAPVVIPAESPKEEREDADS